MTNARLYVWPQLCLVAALLVLGGGLAGPARAAESSVILLAQGGTTFNTPLDATPSPDGAVVFFVARTASGPAGIFRVPARGGAVETVLAGAPLVAPRAIVVSSDGQTLYVADPGARGRGAVFAVPLNGAAVHRVAGTQGLRPRALDLVPDGRADELYIAGIDRATRRAQVWQLDLDRVARPEPLMRGAPLATADGVAARANGEILVAGRTGRASEMDVVLRVRDGVHRRLVNSVVLGDPAGIALTHDQSTLLVSSLAGDGTSQVLIVDLATGATSAFNDVIGANRSSGGLHRAHQANVFAWCSLSPPGRVYRVEP